MRLVRVVVAQSAIRAPMPVDEREAYEDARIQDALRGSRLPPRYGEQVRRSLLHSAFSRAL